MKGRISISRPVYGDGRELISIRIKDENSGERFIALEIGLADFTKALTGQAEIPGELNVSNLDRVGKKMEIDYIDFPFQTKDYSNRKELASEEAKKYTPDGWTCDNYFGSQTSFFTKDGVMMANAVIRRWI